MIGAPRVQENGSVLSVLGRTLEGLFSRKEGCRAALQRLTQREVQQCQNSAPDTPCGADLVDVPVSVIQAAARWLIEAWAHWPEAGPEGLPIHRALSFAWPELRDIDAISPEIEARAQQFVRIFMGKIRSGLSEEVVLHNIKARLYRWLKTVLAQEILLGKNKESRPASLEWMLSAATSNPGKLLEEPLKMYAAFSFTER